MNNKVILAAAGAGKTTYIVERALEIKEERVLITTYTRNNEAEIRSKFIELHQCVPANVVIQTWFSFLLTHGVKPYQLEVYTGKIKGLYFTKKRSVPYVKKTNVERYFFSEKKEIYSDKIAEFVLLCNEKSNGAVSRRISQVFPFIFIDEVQDLAGYDLDFLLLLFDSLSTTCLVGDPRQGTYSTNNAAKGKTYRRAEIADFFKLHQKKYKLDIDSRLLNKNYRCNPSICKFSDFIYSAFPQAVAREEDEKVSHRGVFLVYESDVEKYLKEYNPIQLRYSAQTNVSSTCACRNFGDSKGVSFNRVLMYPTSDMFDFLFSLKRKNLNPITKAKLYVAITRARYSLALVCKNGFIEEGKYLHQDLVKVYGNHARQLRLFE